MISMDKKYRTKDGNDVRIYAVDGNQPYAVHGAWRRSDGWISETWTQTGERMSPPPNFVGLDLVEVMPRIHRTLWLNVYPGVDVIVAHDNHANAREHASAGCLGCVKVDLDFEVGEGLAK